MNKIGGEETLKVIFISGKAQSGKDFIAEKAKKCLENDGKKVLITHFGDKLKFICRNYFDWDGNKDEAGRTLLQNVGTGEIRQNNPDYFANDVLEILKIYSNKWDYVIIPDLRFKNEYEIITKQFESYSIRKSRKNENNLSEIQKNNQSEIELDEFDFNFYIGEYDEEEFLEIMEEIINGKH